MLFGLRNQRALLAGLLAGARGGRGGALVIRGESGMGLGDLVRETAEQAGDMRVLRGGGVESEAGLGFAALHQLLQPVLGGLDRLPGPQAAALRGAFGLGGDPPDRFLVGLAVLGLLAAAAEERPVLCLVTDAQWLDRESAVALQFVGRRIATEPVALLLVARDDHPRRFDPSDLPELRLGGPDPVAAELVAAGTLPDEAVARTLERSAGRARRRGGPLAAAAAMQRAAVLTPAGRPKARRLVTAAERLWEAGRPDDTRELLDQAALAARDTAVRARMARLRGLIELETGTPSTACTLLTEGAQPVLRSRPSLAAEMLVLAARAAWTANELDRIREQVQPATLRLPAEVWPSSEEDLRLRLWPRPMLVAADGSDDDLAARDRYLQSVAAARASGTVGSLSLALANLAFTEVVLDRWPSAVSHGLEGLRVARRAGLEATASYVLAILAWVAAHLGRGSYCRQVAGRAIDSATRHRNPMVAALASGALAHLDLAEGRPAAAMERLLALHQHQHPTAHPSVAVATSGDLVEAAARAGELDGMAPFLAQLTAWAERDRRPWTHMVAYRSQALAGEGEDAERRYLAALAVDGSGGRSFELARTELLYGEWLRRGRRRADARVHLRSALDLFGRLHAQPWTERARSELRASGETARKRDPSTLEQLTPRELQIVRLAVQGLRNREIADQLFLSPHTVSYHLHKVFLKLGITSRAGLRQLDLR